MIGQAAGEGEHRRFRHIGRRQFRCTAPADLDAAEQIGLGPGQLVQARRLEAGILAKNLGIRVELDAGAAAVLGGAQFLDRPLRDPA